MFKLMSTTALVMAFAVSAQAQQASIGVSIGTDGFTGVTLKPSGTSSSATLGVSGFGSGGVVVSNSGLNITIEPDNDVDAATDFMYWPEDNEVDGAITIENDRSVEVSGVLAGIGQVQGVGSTTTTYDAQMIAGAAAEHEGTEDFGGEDATVTFSNDMNGLARLAGESTSEAGMLMVGQTASFLGELGTEVGGDFIATAYFETDNEYYAEGNNGPYIDFEIEGDDNTGIVIESNVDDIDLAIANLGGGSMLLTGSSDDVFEGDALLENGAAFSFLIDGYNPIP